MASYKDRTALVYDNGLFVEFAAVLASSFKRVYYYSPWESGFPRSNALLVGQGVPGIVRVGSIWDVYGDVDLWVFPDVYNGALQEYLVSRGERVWGSRLGEELELDRVWSKTLCRGLGIDIGPYKVIIGTDALRDHLRENGNQFVKISKTRGDMETFFAKNYELIEPRLDELEWALGAKKGIMEFVVEEAIEDAVEVGYDGYVIDGKYPGKAMYGIEVKDKGYVSEVLDYAKLPKSLRDVNRMLKGTFSDFNYRGFWSSEVRVTPEGQAFLIDPCARMGSPPGELYQVMIANWADILWEGAEGVVVEPEFIGRFGAELMLRSSWADRNWQPIRFPSRVREFVKLRNLTVIDGMYYVVPQAVGVPDIGALVGYGDTMEDAIANVKDVAEVVEGYYVETLNDSLTEAQTEYERLKSLE